MQIKEAQFPNKVKEVNNDNIDVGVVFKDNYVSQNHPKFSIKWSNNHQSTWTDYK